MSANLDAVRTATVALVKSGIALDRAEQNVAGKFRASAVATSQARQDGATLQQIADVNREAIGDLDKRAYHGTVYTSVQSVNYHALAGDFMRMVKGAEIDAYVCQDTVDAALRTKGAGTKSVRAALRKSDAVEALAFLADAVKAAKSAKSDDAETSEGDESGESDAPETTPSAKVEILLGSVLALVSQGAEITDSARAILAQLTGPVALPASA